MKRTTKTSRTAGYLEKIFRQLNTDSFNGELEEPIITIQSTPTAYGHVSVAKIWKRGEGEEERHELNISADWLNRPIEEIVATMLHEMSHLMNLKLNIQDCSRGGTYHNKKFKEEAEKHMLKIEHHEKYGWTITSVTDALLEYILNQGWDEIDMNRSHSLYGGGTSNGNGGMKPPVGSGTAKVKPTGSNSRKHKCPCCGRIARTTMDFPLICGICKETMIVEI